MKYKDKEMIFHVYECSDGTIMIREKTGELVRCGECKNWEEKPLIKGNGTRFGTCPLMMGLFFKSDFYCADGERKDGEE